MKDIRSYWWFWVLLFIKAALHLYSATQYGFHRDEFLYLIQSDHLAWGYLEVPPGIAIAGWFVRNILGDTQIAVKILPLICGLLAMGFIVLITRDLGGKRWAQFIAVLTFLISPAFLRTNHLFQPVCFNQLWWIVLAFLVIRLVKSERKQYWYWIGLTVGFGFLTKYSILFLVIAMFLALLISKHRTLLRTREFAIASGIAFCIALPNLLWQYNHNFPVAAHMSELSQTQLVHVEPLGFIIGQFLMQFAGSLIWLPGLLALFFSRHLRKYRFAGYGYAILMALLLALSGKDYYMLGIYPVLFAAGSVWLEIVILKKALRFLIPILLVLINSVAIPYGLPVLSIEGMQSYSKFMMEEFGLSGPLKWEDGNIYALPQDYADMHGWEEMAQRVSKIYHNLPDSLRERCHILGGSYSHASTLTYFRHKYDLPEVHSLVGSHLLWIRGTIGFDRQILIDDVRSLESSYFNNVQLVDSIRNPYAREPGYIYYRTGPKMNLDSAFHALVEERKLNFTRR